MAELLTPQMHSTGKGFSQHIISKKEGRRGISCFEEGIEGRMSLFLEQNNSLAGLLPSQMLVILFEMLVEAALRC